MKVNITEHYKFRSTALNWLIKKYEDCERIVLGDEILFRGPDGKIVMSYNKDKVLLEVSKKDIWDFLHNRAGMDKMDADLIIRAFVIDFFKLKDLKYGGKIVPTKRFDLDEKETLSFSVTESQYKNIIESKNKSPETEVVNEKLQSLKNVSKTLVNLKPSKVIPYDESVEVLQTGLQILGFSLPRWGIDGKFGNETEKAVKDFQKENNLDPNGKADKKTLELISKLSTEKLEKNPEIIKSIQKTKTEELPDTEDRDSKTKSTTDGEYIIFKPENYTGKDVHVLFGGAHTNMGGSVRMSNMEKYIPILKPQARNVIIVLTHHANNLNSVKKYVKEKFDGNVVSIAGFSQGGKETWKYATDGSLRFVGLIDPSTYDIGLDIGSNTVLLANPSNWGGKPFVDAVRKRLEWYCSHKDDSEYSGRVECPKVSHWKFLTYFYDKYNSRL